MNVRRFEMHIEQRGYIAECVLAAIKETTCLVTFVTRWSIASLWALMELHSAPKADVPVALLLQLFQSVTFPHPTEDFDLSVHYDQDVVDELRRAYSLRESVSRTARNRNQVCDFLATLPSYPGSLPPNAMERVWRPAFTRLPAGRGGDIKPADLEGLARIFLRNPHEIL